MTVHFVGLFALGAVVSPRAPMLNRGYFSASAHPRMSAGRGAGAASPATEGAAVTTEGAAAQAIRRYFDAWNRRAMDEACAQFAEDCVYDDTQYKDAFTGKEALRFHLNRVADALPSTFQFVIDDIADGGNKVGVQWHVENNGQPLPFTRGCSLFKANQEGLLVSGFDVPEPAVVKPGSASLLILGVASKIIAEPVRALPAAAWLAYVSIVFFSNGILPGPDATQLDSATWQEVLGLSLNFWLVAPLLHLPFSPALHPGLEGIFNLLLAWAAAFAGFLADGRPGRASGSMLPTIGGMQLLTNAVLLPYLVVRSPEEDQLCTQTTWLPSSGWWASGEAWARCSHWWARVRSRGGAWRDPSLATSPHAGAPSSSFCRPTGSPPPSLWILSFSPYSRAGSSTMTCAGAASQTKTRPDCVRSPSLFRFTACAPTLPSDRSCRRGAQVAMGPRECYGWVKLDKSGRWTPRGN
jgi:ketosteroid isomerase-like protein